MSNEHSVDEVFGITRDIPLNYIEREPVDGKLLRELVARHHVVIYGSSKQGKTSLRKHCLKEDQYILIQCSNKSDLSDLHGAILKRAGFEITQSTKKSVSGKNKIIISLKAAVKAAIFGIGTQIEGGISDEQERTTGTDITYAPLEIDIDDVNDVIAALKAINFNKWIVMEDFHYLPYEIQRDFSIELKAFHESSKITFIIVGVWLEDNRLIVYNGDLTGRVISVNADKWENLDLNKVIKKGGDLLNVDFDATFVSELILLARESVYVVQESCKRACVLHSVSKTCATKTPVGAGLNVEDIVKEVVDQQSARYNGFLKNFADGFQDTELEMHKWLLYPILTANIEILKDGLKFRDIKAVLLSKHPRERDLNPGNITQSLQSSASLQVKKNIMPIIIDYDQTTRTLHVVDKGFLIWLQHQEPEDLLDDIGLPL